jgi:hypothetical protein
MAKKCSEERTLAHPSTGAFRANLPVMKRLSLVAAAVVVVVAVTAIAVALIETRSDGGPRGPLGSLTGTPPIGEARSGGLMGTLVYADNAIGSGTVWRANADGTHPVRLTNGSDPSISPNGRLVTLVRPTCTSTPPGVSCRHPKVFVMTTSGGKVERIRGMTSANDLAWAPDSRRLAVGAVHRIYVFDLASGAETLIAKGRFVCCPSFSPDGRFIVYDRFRRSSTSHSGSSLASDLYVFDLTSGKSQRITRFGDARDPVWGPSEIAFGHNHEIWLIDGNGSHLRQLTNKPSTTYTAPAVWSADGKLLLLSIVAWRGPGKFRAIDVPGGKLSFAGSGNALGLSRDGKVALVDDCAAYGPGITFGRVETVSLKGGRARAVVPHNGICQASWIANSARTQ